MARIKYYYDTDTCKYERIRLSKTDIFMNTLGIFFLILICAFLLLWISQKFFPTPKETALQREVYELKHYNKITQTELGKLKEIVGSLENRDNDIYRIILEADPIDQNMRTAGYGGSERYDVTVSSEGNEKMIKETFKEINKLKKRLYAQTQSYDEIIQLAQNKDELLASMPGIQPVSDKNGKRFSSGFGYRMHPILKIRKMHAGVDFAAKRGTPIYATGNGKVIKASKNGAYGNLVVIDHGFGFKTKYAHMQKFAVKRNQKVKRGDLIGYIGSTGRSTAPHLHYEVLKNNKPVNPVNYFTYGLTPEQYETILKKSQVENQSLE